MSILDDVMEQAKQGHKYVKDPAKYGVSEHWKAELVGDCDSFALWCRERLIEAGQPAPLLAFCRVPGGGGHLVCMTAEGLVLDNRQVRVCHMRDLDYQWISAGPFPDGSWREFAEGELS